MQLLINHSPVKLSSSDICGSAVLTQVFNSDINLQASTVPGGTGLHGAGSPLLLLLALLSWLGPGKAVEAPGRRHPRAMPLILVHCSQKEKKKRANKETRSPKGSWGHCNLRLPHSLAPRWIHLREKASIEGAVIEGVHYKGRVERTKRWSESVTLHLLRHYIP